MAFPPVSSLIANGFPKFLTIAYHRMIESSIIAFIDLNLADRLIDTTPDIGSTLDKIIIKDDKSTSNKDVVYHVLRACVVMDIVKEVNDDKYFILTESDKMLTSNHPSHASGFLKFYMGFETTSALSKLVNVGRGDIFQSSTIPQGDAYLITQVLHDFSDEQVIDILSAIRKANENSSRKTITIFIVEYIILDDESLSNWQSIVMDMLMICMIANGKERIQQAGFHFKQLYPVEAPTSIIEGCDGEGIVY